MKFADLHREESAKTLSVCTLTIKEEMLSTSSEG
jgi:hypothetical protein